MNQLARTRTDIKRINAALGNATYINGSLLGRNLISVLVLTRYTNDSTLLGNALFTAPSCFCLAYRNITLPY